MFSDYHALYETMWGKCLTAGQATDDNMVHAHCMLDTYGYYLTLSLCNTYYFSTATMVAQNATMLRHTYIACHVGVLLLLLYLRQRSKFSLNFVYSSFIGGNNSPTTIFSHHYLRTGSGVQQAFIKGNGTIS
jgi:hypothetical protein